MQLAFISSLKSFLLPLHAVKTLGINRKVFFHGLVKTTKNGIPLYFNSAAYFVAPGMMAHTSLKSRRRGSNVAFTPTRTVV